MDKLQKALETVYYAKVDTIEECDILDTLYYAYLPDFGHAACSAVGDTEKESLELLQSVKEDVIHYLVEKGRDIPEPVFRSEYPLLPEISSNVLGSCPLCGELSEITKVTDVSTSVIKGVVLAHPVTFFRCESCKDTFDTADTMDSSVKSAQDMYEEIRKLTEEDCAEIYEFAMKRSREILGGVVEDVVD